MNKKFQYTTESMEKAIEFVKNGNSISNASSLFKVPRTTLSDKIKEKYAPGAKAGPSTVLSAEEENLLVRWLYNLADYGFPVTKAQLLNSVQDLIVKSKRKNPFTNDKPGKKWFSCFLKRHPELALRVSQNLTRSRSNITENSIRQWFSRVERCLKIENQFDVLQDPTRIFNCDETAFYLAPKESQVLVKKGAKQVYTRIANDEKECLTVLINIRASGDMSPPMVLFSYKRLPQQIVYKMPKDWGIGTSENGWMTSQTFYEYITNVFYPWIIKKKITLPVILFMDGHKSHISLPLSEFCNEKQIILVALLPNATHVLQPCDVGLFHPLKSEWKNSVKNYRWQNDGKKLDRENFAPLLEECLKISVKPTTIKNSFKTTGLFPFNCNNINFNKLITIRDDLQQNEISLTKSKADTDASFIKKFESKLDPKLLLQFEASANFWEGELEYKALFEFWKKEKNIENEEITSIAIEESFWFEDQSIIELNILGDGSVVVDKEQLTPIKENPLQQNFPTPFKTTLFWPEINTTKVIAKNRKKTTPVVATSQEFIAHLQKEKAEKDKAEQDKIERKNLKVLKQKEKENLQQKIKRRKLTIENTMLNKENMTNNETIVSNDILINEELTTTQDIINVGDYVIVTYEAELFPGLVLEVLEDEFKVKTMVMLGQNWKWPERDDICIYQKKDVVKIVPPCLINNRGVYSVPEVQKLKSI